MRAWFRHFDRNQNGRIERVEFDEALKLFNYSDERIAMMWTEIDQDHDGHISFDEIDYEQTLLWNTFRRWCAANFASARDMIIFLRDGYAERHGLPKTTEENLTRLEFTEGLQELGWSRGFEALLFSVLDVDGEESIVARGLEWFNSEVLKHNRKEELKKKALHLKQKAMERKNSGQVVLQDFKIFLRRTFGHLFRGWRKALDLDGSMSVCKAEIFKACHTLQWKGDVRALWTALDHDGSGTTELEELDPQCAQLLAQFQDWAVQTYGPRPSTKLFAAWDKRKRKKLTYEIFIQEVETGGFTRKVKTLAQWFDWQDKKYLLAEDFAFLDFWKPPKWIIATPNEAAVAEFRRALQAKYGNMLKGWRHCLDKDGSNTCTWHEFMEGVKTLRLQNFDIAGAWLSLDHDLNGYITLREISLAAYNVFMEFKQWVENEFGGVKSAFVVLDLDASGDLTYHEFRGICRNYGFHGDTKTLFESLDVHQGTLNMKEVAFLDDWEDIPTSGAAGGGSKDTGLDPILASRDKEPPPMPELLEWGLPAPGPGAYNVPALFGASSHLPGCRHGGAFSFGGLKTARPSRTVGPGAYNASVRPTTARKPSWSFGGSATGRGYSDASPRCASAGPQRRPCRADAAAVGGGRRRGGAPAAGEEEDEGQCDDGRTSPGPAAYEPRALGFEGPKYSMRPRRGWKLHPAMNAQGVNAQHKCA